MVARGDDSERIFRGRRTWDGIGVHNDAIGWMVVKVGARGRGGRDDGLGAKKERERERKRGRERERVKMVAYET